MARWSKVAEAYPPAKPAKYLVTCARSRSMAPFCPIIASSPLPPPLPAAAVGGIPLQKVSMSMSAPRAMRTTPKLAPPSLTGWPNSTRRRADARSPTAKSGEWEGRVKEGSLGWTRGGRTSCMSVDTFSIGVYLFFAVSQMEIVESSNRTQMGIRYLVSSLGKRGLEYGNELA